MSKKFILNDNEVAFNEDIEQNDDWRGRDLFRLMEAMFNGFHTSAPGSLGSVQAGAVVAGLTSGVSATNLEVTVFSGTALMAFGGLDSDATNGYQMCALEDNVTLPLPAAPVGSYRWDLIEVSASQATTNETREVLGFVGPSRVLSPTSVPKLQDNRLSVRVRSGIPNATRDMAFLPDLGASSAWIPLFAIEVTPGALTASSLTRIDLRKLLTYSQPQEWVADGFDFSPHLYSESSVIAGPRNWVTMSGYRSPTIPPIGRDQFTKLELSPQEDMAAGLSPTVYDWYYVYAYRPHSNSGYTSVFISDVPPTLGNVGAPSASITLPWPFPTTASTPPAHYLGAVRFYESGSVYIPRPFRQHSGYVSVTGSNIVDSPTGGGGTNVIVVNQTISTNTTVDVNSVFGRPSIPPHARTAKIYFRFRNTGGVTASATVNTTDNWLCWEDEVLAGEVVTAVVDVPLTLATPQQFKINVLTGSLVCSATMLGYYEEAA